MKRAKIKLPTLKLNKTKIHQFQLDQIAGGATIANCPTLDPRDTRCLPPRTVGENTCNCPVTVNGC